MFSHISNILHKFHTQLTQSAIKLVTITHFQTPTTGIPQNFAFGV